jgi:integrase
VQGAGYREGKTKTEATLRTIPLPQFAVKILRERRARYGLGLLFQSRLKGGGPISQNNLRLILRRAIAGSEFDGWFTPHTARKTNLTAVNDVHGAEVASKVAGHSDGGKLIRSTYGERRPLAPNVTAITERFGRQA